MEANMRNERFLPLYKELKNNWGKENYTEVCISGE
jgi:hypothetical protein